MATLKKNILYILSCITIALLLGVNANVAMAHQGHNHSHGDGHNHGHNHSHGDGHNHHGIKKNPQKVQGKTPITSARPNAHEKGHDNHAHDDGHGEKDGPDIGTMIMHHITDAHEFHVAGDFSIPLPCIVYSQEKGFDFFLTNKFHHGHNAYHGYMLEHGVLKSIEPAKDGSPFPKDYTGEIHLKGHDEDAHVTLNGKSYPIKGSSNLLSSGSFYDFSITKVVFTMLVTALIMLFLFPSIAKAYSRNEVPSGKQSFFEPIIEFVRDDIAKPSLGEHKYKPYMPYLLTVFFFIWITNMLGLVPFFPGSGNATGNIAVTLTLSVFTFLIVTFSGNKNYWGHIFNPPGVPMGIKPIMILIEFLSMFIKPFALMLRLFANITAGHIIILSFVGLIFIAAHLAGTAGGFAASILSGAFMLFMNVLELFVAALQAYVFTVLSAVFIGQAIEEHHHEEAHH